MPRFIVLVLFLMAFPVSAQDEPLFGDGSDRLPSKPGTLGYSMDAHPIDIEGDGDLDILIAYEFRPNLLWRNEEGHFSDASERLPNVSHDSEDVGVADFDGDGDLDAIIVSEDDVVNELLINDGDGYFADEAANRLPAEGISNAVLVADINADGAPDILIGNNGQNVLLINDGAGIFTDETADRLPSRADTTQDLELGDVDGDGDLDLLVGNEEDNRLLINTGEGVFVDESADRLVYRNSREETREADFGDVDGDGDLDIFFANVRFFVPTALQQNRLLINTGGGFFRDETADRLPQAFESTIDGDFVDVDADGDLDLVTGNGGVQTGGMWRVLINDGAGNFTDETERLFPSGVTGTGFDSESADFDGDGVPDLYLANRGGPDYLLLGR